MANMSSHLPWSDPAHLREQQYRDDSNLVARQSIYDYQSPRLDLASLALDLAELEGHERVADIGCGNGAYLAELCRRGHQGPLVALDLSIGMLASAAAVAPTALPVAADVCHLPLRPASVDLALAMHMLYHAPGPEQAVHELRRVLKPGGTLLVVLNGGDHLRQLGALAAAAMADLGRSVPPGPFERFTLDHGEALLRASFSFISRHDYRAELAVPESAPVERYVNSMGTAGAEEKIALASAVRARLVPHLKDGGTFTVSTHSGCLVCR